MTLDEAKAAYEQTGSMSKAAAILGVHHTTVSRTLKAAGVVVARPPVNALVQRENILSASLTKKEFHLLGIMDSKEADASLRDVGVVFGILEDKRYRVDHPESVPRGVQVNIDQSQQVHVTAETLDALRAARQQLLSEAP